MSPSGRCTILGAMSLLLRVLLLPWLAGSAFAASLPKITAPVAIPGADGSVTFAATIDARGGFTSVVFQYGRTGAYGKKTTPVFVSATGTGTVASATATGLLGGRTYHFRVVATNDAGAATTPDATFTVTPYAPVLTIEKPAKLVAGTAQLKARITPQGHAGTALFQYALSATFADPVLTAPQTFPIAGDEEAFPLSTQATGLERDKTYSVRLVFRRPEEADAFSGSETFTTNRRPVARPDTFSVNRLRPTGLDVLKNDRDADGDSLKVKAVTGATKGTASATLGEKSVGYVPGANFRGTDTFTYTVTDGFSGADVTATVSVRALGLLLRGNQGAVLRDENGDPIGYLKLTTTEGGTVTGTVQVGGEKRSFSGVFGPDGTLSSTLKIDGRTVPLTLTAAVNGTTTTVDAALDDGRWSSTLRTTEASAAQRADLAGRYTVEFPGGTSTSEPATGGADPGGTGWATLKLSPDGAARIKGRLPDGRAFSTRGALGVASTGTGAVVTFFDDPSRTRVAGTLTIGGSLGGALTVQRDAGGSGDFAAGYALERTASGARYLPPPSGQRAIEGTSAASGRTLSFAVSGGGDGVDFTRQIRLDENDRVRVLDAGAENLKLRIDRESGRFLATFTGATDDQRIKGSGVFIQSPSGSGRGAGIFKGEEQTGRIAITAGGSTTGTTDTTATTTR